MTATRFLEFALSVVLQGTPVVLLTMGPCARTRGAATRWRPWTGCVELRAGLAIAAVVRILADAPGSSRSSWSPWPAGTARALRDLGCPVRDFEVSGPRSRLSESGTDRTSSSSPRLDTTSR